MSGKQLFGLFEVVFTIPVTQRQRAEGNTKQSLITFQNFCDPFPYINTE